METLTHWKKLRNNEYIGSYSLNPGEDLNVTIESVSKEMVTGADGKKEQCTVMKLKGQKPMILNATNSKTIAKVTGSPFIEKWAGKKITLYVANVKAFGEVVEALRVRATAPQLPVLNPQHAKWESAKTALKSGQVTMDQIKSNYQISASDEKAILS